MQRNLNILANTRFDLIVIGGGITGAFLAYDAVSRGLSVALVEKDDFGASTSSASSKLLHGGVRYLARGQFWKVRESYRESAIFQRLAPHLTHWVPFLVPTYAASPMKGKLALDAAMMLYDLCRTGLDDLITDPAKRPPAGGFLTPGEACAEAASLNSVRGLTGAHVLWESHMYSSERMTLAVLESAESRGAKLANYLQVESFLTGDDRVEGVRVSDRFAGDAFEIRASLTINAAGPQAQLLTDKVPGLKLKRRLTGFSKGVHLVTRQLEPHYALAVATERRIEGLVTRGGRHVFAIPWRGHTLIGTTNTPFTGDPGEVRVSSADIEDFIAEINSAIPAAHLTRRDVGYAFGGIYPLTAVTIDSDTYQGTGDYQVVDHERHTGIAGVITVLGAKFTTARRVAEIGVDLAVKRLHRTAACQTRTASLDAGAIDDLEAFRLECRASYGREVPEDVLEAMICRHGCGIHDLIDRGRARNLLRRTAVGRSVLDIEIDHAVTHEMAMTLDDVIFRRTDLGTIGHPGRDALRHCADFMGDRLDWSVEERQRQIDRVEGRYDFESTD